MNNDNPIGLALDGFMYFDHFAASVNGSSKAGGCSILFGFVSCGTNTTPTLANVLFDGNIPTLTRLDGDMWASDLLTLHEAGIATIQGAFRPIQRAIHSIEVVLFNCPQWGIGTSNITILGRDSSGQAYVVSKTIPPSLTSCDSLVRICILTAAIYYDVFLYFQTPPGSNWTHLAEIVFYSWCADCPFDTIVRNHSPMLSVITSANPTKTAPATIVRMAISATPRTANG